MPNTLRSKLIRLAHAKPELRGDLLPLLSKKAVRVPRKLQKDLQEMYEEASGNVVEGKTVFDDSGHKVSRYSPEMALEYLAVVYESDPDPIDEFHPEIAKLIDSL